MLGAVAVLDLVDRLLLKAHLKWPNDVLVGGRKICGVLPEARTRGSERFVVLGIGLNIGQEEQDFPPPLQGRATSLGLCGVRCSVAGAARKLIDALDSRRLELRA